MFEIVNDNEIRMTRGDTFETDVEIFDEENPWTPSSGDTVKFYVKHAAMNVSKTAYKDDEPVIEKTIPNATLTLHLDPADTEELDFGRYVYDVEVTLSTGVVDTIINNENFIILPEVG